MSARDSYRLQGGQGGQAYNSADGAVTGVAFSWMSCAENTVLSVLTNSLIRNGASKLITITLPAGYGFGGLTTAFTVTSGTIVGYDQ